MSKLSQSLPDPALLVTMEPEELGPRLLFLLRKDFPNKDFHPGNISYMWSDYEADWKTKEDIDLAAREALTWLSSQSLIVRAAGDSGNHGWMTLSRRAQKLAGSQEMRDFAAARMLPKEAVHESIRDSAWIAFLRGSYPTAVFEAMRQVEIAVREAAAYEDGDHGVPMVRRAFDKTKGPLTNLNQEEAEREALAALFAGAIGSYKNPHSHRNVPLDDPLEAAEIVMLASHLLRIVDGRRIMRELLSW